MELTSDMEKCQLQQVLKKVPPVIFEVSWEFTAKLPAHFIARRTFPGNYLEDLENL